MLLWETHVLHFLCFSLTTVPKFPGAGTFPGAERLEKEADSPSLHQEFIKGSYI